MVSVFSPILNELELLWPILLAGIVVFAIWGAAKTAARTSGTRFGLAGIALVLFGVAVVSWILGQQVLAIGVGFLGIIALVVAFSGNAR